MTRKAIEDCSGRGRFDDFLVEVEMLEQEIIGLMPSERKVIEYNSGKKMLKDAGKYMLNELGISALSGASIWRKQFFGRTFRQNKKKFFLLLPFSPFYFLWWMLIDYSCFCADSEVLLGVSINEKIMICWPNIAREAERKGYKIEDFEKFIVIHEEIHNSQSANFSISEMKKKLFKEQNRAREMFFNGTGEKREFFKRNEETEAFMAATEGHAEFFSKKIANRLLPDFHPQPKQDILYKSGEFFISHLYFIGGADLANLSLRFPPKTAQEIKKPQMYLSRVLFGEES